MIINKGAKLLVISILLIIKRKRTNKDFFSKKFLYFLCRKNIHINKLGPLKK